MVRAKAARASTEADETNKSAAWAQEWWVSGFGHPTKETEGLAVAPCGRPASCPTLVYLQLFKEKVSFVKEPFDVHIPSNRAL